MRELDNEISNGLEGNLYLIFGEERFLVSSYEEKMKNAVVDANSTMAMMNQDVFEGGKISPNLIADAFTTMSFANDRRIVIVKNSGLFYRGRTDDSAKMVEYFGDLSEDVVVVFVEENVDKRSKIYKYIAKNGKNFELSKLDEGSLSKWIIQLVEKEGGKISVEDAKYLARVLSFDMNKIFSELNKVIDHNKNEKISKEDIDNLVNKSLEVKIFELVEAIGNKKPEKALNIFNNMLQMKESPLMILTMIGRQFKLIFECKCMLETGVGADAIAPIIGAHPFVVKQCLKQSKNFSKIALYQGFEDVLLTDVNIKTGKISDRLGVELIIIKYSN